MSYVHFKTEIVGKCLQDTSSHRAGVAVTLYIRTGEMLCGDLGSGTDYPDTFYVVFFCPSRQIPRYYLDYATTASFLSKSFITPQFDPT
jgi:hypothetical protein